MSGFTVIKTPVVTTNLVKVLCNACNNECDYNANESMEIIYTCTYCGIEHPYPDGKPYPDVEYVTE